MNACSLLFMHVAFCVAGVRESTSSAAQPSCYRRREITARWQPAVDPANFKKCPVVSLVWLRPGVTLAVDLGKIQTHKRFKGTLFITTTLSVMTQNCQEPNT